MPFPTLAVAGAGLGASAIGSLFGGGSGPDIPDWVDDLLENYAQQENFIGYTPDPAAFDSSLRAQFSQIKEEFGYNQQAFRANAASRGVFSSGESLSEEYRNVNLPAINAANVAASNASLGFEQLQFNVATANARVRQSAIAQLLQRFMATQKGGNVADAIGDVGGLALNYSLLQQFAGG